jgi:threonine synthase
MSQPPAHARDELAHSLLDHLECSATGETFPADGLRNLSPAGEPLLPRYRLGPHVPRPPHRGPGGMWRYAALLPHRGTVVTLGEGWTPLLPAPRLGAQLGLPLLWVKDESQNPTASFKARGIATAVTMAKALGVIRLAIPTAGHAGGALAAYGARAGIAVEVFMPRDTPEAFQLEARLHGAQVHLVDGLISECGKLVAAGAAQGRWFDCSTFKEPYRVEGKKTMGYELWEQMGGQLPDAILYPTGGGTGLIGMWKAFEELAQLGWHTGQRPRMVAVQVAGCAPVVRAFQEGAARTRFWDEATTLAYGLRVPKPLADALILRALRESAGTAVAVAELEMLAGMHELAASEGISSGPETGAVVAAAAQLARAGWLTPQQTVVLFNTGSQTKYPDAARAALQRAHAP